MDMDLSLGKKSPELLVMLDQADLAQLLLLIQDIIGIPFPKDRLGDLARHLRDMALSLRFQDQRDFVKWFLNDADHAERMELLARQLTIGETYFFRDEKNFHLLGNEILPELHHSNKERITLWSAGCSSGEEPYTMAMTAQTPLSNKEVHIVASDVNPVALDKARLGIYSGWSFRNPPPGILERYFTKVGHDKFQIISQIQKKVIFMKVNLVAESYPSPLDKPAAVDVIFCRNVLMYFTKEKRDEIIDKFCVLLAEDGWFVVSPSESALIQHPGLTIDRSSEPNVFRKRLVKKQIQPVIWGATHNSPRPTVSIQPAREARKTLPKPRSIGPLGVKKSFQEDGVLEKAKILFGDRRLTEAASLLTGYLDTQKKPDPSDSSARHQEAIVLLAKIQANLGNLDQAEQGYRRAIATDRLQADYYYDLALILLEKGDPDGAVALLEKTLFLQPDLVIAHLQLASLCRDKKRAGKFARNVLDLLKNASPDSIVPFSDGLTAATIIHMAHQITDNGLNK